MKCAYYNGAFVCKKRRLQKWQHHERIFCSRRECVFAKRKKKSVKFLSASTSSLSSYLMPGTTVLHALKSGGGAILSPEKKGISSLAKQRRRRSPMGICTHAEFLSPSWLVGVKLHFQPKGNTGRKEEAEEAEGGLLLPHTHTQETKLKRWCKIRQSISL